jgi:antitoxin MazE
MTTITIKRHGRSLIIPLPADVAARAGLAEGSPVELSETASGLLLRPATRPRYNLADLIAGITPENLPDETFDDRPRGAELL